MFLVSWCFIQRTASVSNAILFYLLVVYFYLSVDCFGEVIFSLLINLVKGNNSIL
jgi:hypothetical protein